MAQKKNESVFPAESAQFFTRTMPGAREQIKSYPELKKLLDGSAVELVFMRRRWPIKFTEIGRNKPWRRMLCTANWAFLGQHRRVYGFRPPRANKLRSAGWYKRRNLIIVFDLVRRDWRMISADDYFVVSHAPLASKEQASEFKAFYDGLREKKSERQLLALFDA